LLTKVEVKGNGWFQWRPKDDTSTPVPIEAGEYYAVVGQLKKEYKDTFKNRMAPQAAVDPNGRFQWLLPYEKWVKAAIDGALNLQRYGEVEDGGDSREVLAASFNVDRGLVDHLRSWQRDFLYDFLVAQEAGLEYRRAAVIRVGGGKTLCGLLLARKHKTPLVLAPSYCWNSWKDEATKWKLDCPKLSTYQSAHKHSGVDCLILDEALLVANPSTQIHGSAIHISRRAQTVVGLTGTPQSCTPMDLRWLRAVYPGCVPSEEKPWRYLFGVDTELVEVKPGQKAYVTKTWNQEAVSKFVAPYVMVVKPEDIVKELPEITYQRLTVPKPKEYDLILKGAATEKGKSKALAQARMCTDGSITDDAGRILARLNTYKCDAIREYLINLGEPAVLFARWAYMVNELAGLVPSTGTNAAKASVLSAGGDHEEEVRRFVSGESPHLVASAGLCQGMNLQERSRVVIFASNSLKPTDREQAIGRVYRPGQKRGVVVVDVVAEGTLDEVALNLLEKHKDRSEAYIEAALAREFRRLSKGS
jgi:superfamily II DNA or RNA helicase